MCQIFLRTMHLLSVLHSICTQKVTKQFQKHLNKVLFLRLHNTVTNPIIDVDGDKATGKWLLWVGVNGGEANIVFESEDVKYTRTSRRLENSIYRIICCTNAEKSTGINFNETALGHIKKRNGV